MARHQLKGKYGMAVALCFLYFAINLVISILDSTVGQGSSIGSMVLSMLITVVTIALMAGSYYFCLNIARDRDYNITDLFVMFNPSGGLRGLSALIVGNIMCGIITLAPFIPFAVCLYYYIAVGNILFLAPVPFLLIIGIVLSTYFALTYYFLPLVILDHCNETIPAFALMKACAGIVKGQKLRLFYMLVSFIGWIFVGIFTFGIGFLWIMPYIQTSVCVFYDDITAQPLSQQEAHHTPQMQDTEDNPF